MRLKPSLLAILPVVCLGSIIYSNSFHVPFSLDDVISISGNTNIKNVFNLHDIWDFWPSRFITYFSFSLNYRFDGLNVFGYHFFNLVVHLISAVLVWWLTLLTLTTPAFEKNSAKSNEQGILKDEKISRHADLIAFFTALIFVAHPIQIEAVTYIVQRAASLAAMFYLASVCFYIKFRLQEAKGSGPIAAGDYYLVALVMACLAMFTKEIVITLPLMLLLYEFTFFKSIKDIRWKGLIPFFLIILIIPLSESRADRLHKICGDIGISSIHYLMTQFRVMITYIRLVFMPFKQNLDYDYPVYKDLFEAQVFASILLLLSVLFLTKRLFLKYRIISFSILWFFLTLMPESSFFPIRDVIFEHRLYLPMVGFSMFLVSGVYYLWAKNSIKAMVIILTMVIACYAVLTYQRNKVWENDFTLWNDAVRKSPHKARPYFNRSIAYQFKGDLPDAVIDYRKALFFDPGFAITYPKFAALLEGQGDLNKAVSEYRRLINADSPHASAYLDWGKDYQKHGVYDKAIIYYSIAASIDPNLSVAYYGRGICYLNERKLDQALKDLTQAAGLNPNLVEIHYDLAIIYYLKSDYSRAWISTHKALLAGCKIDPKFLIDLKKASGD